MSRPPGLPLLVQLAGQPVLVVGAGRVAARKAEPMLNAGARVHVVAPRATEEIRTAAQAGRLRWEARAYRREDVEAALLVVAATDDEATNARIAADAAARGRLCVGSGSGAAGTAALPAVLRRGPLTVSVSTDGGAPAVARLLRKHLEAIVGPEWGALAEVVSEVRDDPQVRARLAALDPDARRRRWRALPLPDILASVRAGDLQAAREVTASCLSSSSG